MFALRIFKEIFAKQDIYKNLQRRKYFTKINLKLSKTRIEFSYSNFGFYLCVCVFSFSFFKDLQRHKST